MNTYIRTLITTTLATVGFGMSRGSCEAVKVIGGSPMAPVTVTVREARNVLWDVTQVSELHDLSLHVARLNASASFVVDFAQDGAGKLKGAGVTNLSVDSALFAGTITNAAYRVSGAITSQGGVARVVYQVTVTAPLDVNGKRSRLLGTKTVTLTLNAMTGVVTGRYIDKLSALGLGSGFEPQALADGKLSGFADELGDGSWTLSMNLAEVSQPEISSPTAIGLQSSEPAIGQQGSGTAIGQQGSGTAIGPQSSEPAIGPQENGPIIGPQSSEPTIGQQGSGTAIGPQSSEPTIGQQGSGTAIGQQASGIAIGPQSSEPAIGPQENGPIIGPQSSEPAIGQQGSGTAIGPQSSEPSIGSPGRVVIPGPQIIGNASLILATGARYDFLVKGIYASNTGLPTFTLAPTANSKGSNLKVVLRADGTTVFSIQRKVSGQVVNFPTPGSH